MLYQGPFVKNHLESIFRICVETCFPGKSSNKQVPHGSLAELQKAARVIQIVLLIGKLGPAVRALPTAAGKVGELIGGSAICRDFSPCYISGIETVTVDGKIALPREETQDRTFHGELAGCSVERGFLPQ